MGDNSIMTIDRLLIEPTIDVVIESQNKLHTSDLSFETALSKLVECRICHDEDYDSNMETPCACCGTLKHAHRRCVQRWCNEKGNTICEICLQPFEPGYTSPRQLFHYSGVPMNFRGNWEISSNLQFSAMSVTDYDALDFDFNFDDYIVPSSTSLICCRIAVIFLIILIVLRHVLPIIIDGTGAYSTTMFMLHLLRITGILLPVYIMARAFTGNYHRQQQPDHRDLMSDDESNLLQTESQPHLIHVH